MLKRSLCSGPFSLSRTSHFTGALIASCQLTFPPCIPVKPLEDKVSAGWHLILCVGDTSTTLATIDAGSGHLVPATSLSDSGVRTPTFVGLKSIEMPVLECQVLADIGQSRCYAVANISSKLRKTITPPPKSRAARTNACKTFQRYNCCLV